MLCLLASDPTHLHILLRDIEDLCWALLVLAIAVLAILNILIREIFQTLNSYADQKRRYLARRRKQLFAKKHVLDRRFDANRTNMNQAHLSHGSTYLNDRIRNRLECNLLYWMRRFTRIINGSNSS